MATILSKLILPIALAAVAFVLLLGLVNMMRGGSPNTSQRLMRLRVLLQFVAIVITMIAVWAMAPPRSVAVNAGQNTICAFRPTEPWTRPMPQSAWRGCI